MDAIFFTVASMGDVSASSLSMFIERGGLLMWPLLFCSLLTVTVVFERLIVYTSAAFGVRRGRVTVQAVYAALATGKVEEAIAIGKTAGPVGRFLAEGITQRDYGFSESLEEAGQQIISRLGKRLSILDTMVTLAPMLGILGTVTGIIGSFHLLGTAEAGADPASVSVGIAEALVTTATGLIVSMTALVPFNMFKSRLLKWARTLERAARHAQQALKKGSIDET